MKIIIIEYGGTDECEECNSNVFGSIYRILDKYKAESEDKIC